MGYIIVPQQRELLHVDRTTKSSSLDREERPIMHGKKPVSGRVDSPDTGFFVYLFAFVGWLS